MKFKKRNIQIVDHSTGQTLDFPTFGKPVGEEAIADLERSVNDKIAELKTLVGTPLQASTISAMTNEEKIYVYTGSETGYTNGHWYYYDGSAWQDGGVYNSIAIETDKTLSIENMPADAKKTGDEIDALKEDLNNTADFVGGRKYTVFEDGGYIANAGNVGDVIDYETVVDNINFKHLVIPCNGGDVFEFYGDGGASARLYSFVDENGAILEVSTTNAHHQFVLNAPVGAKYFVFNNRKTETKAYIIHGKTIADRIDKNSIAIADVSKSILWEDGGITAAAGTNASNTKRCRTVGFIPRNITYIEGSNNYSFAAFLYTSNGDYVGILKEDGSYSTTVTWLHKLNLDGVLPYYKVRLVVGFDPDYSSVNITTSACSNIRFFTASEQLYDVNVKTLWKIGGIVSTTGEDANNAKRLRSTFLDAYCIEKIVFNPTIYKIVIYVYENYTFKGLLQNDGNTVSSSVNWFSSGVINIIDLPQNIRIRILLARNDDAVLNISEWNATQILGVVTSEKETFNIPIDAKCAKKIATITSIGADANVKAISHRGTRLTRPDSTSAAYIRASECGFAYAEGDIQITYDGKYVIGHEDNIISRTGLDINISETSLSDLKEIDFGGYLFPEYAGQAILTLEEFLCLCDKLGMIPVLDFKTKTQAEVAEILTIIDRYGAEIYNINASLDTLKYILAIKPDQFVRRSYTAYSSTVTSEISSLFADFPNAKFMIAYDRTESSWTDAVLESILDQGIKLMPYEINDASHYNSACLGKYYIHNIMCGGEFNPAVYTKSIDNNIMVTT